VQKITSLDKIADKVIEITERVGEDNFIDIISNIEFSVFNSEHKKFLCIVSTCCKVFGVSKSTILNYRYRKKSEEVECTALIFKLAKAHTTYRVIDIAFFLKIKSVKYLHRMQSEYCDNLIISIPRHKELLEKHVRCEAIIKKQFIN